MTLRIALCITELELGGAERMLVELATRLDSRRFQVVVYSLGPRPNDSAPSESDTGSPRRAQIHQKSAMLLGASPFFQQAAQGLTLADELDRAGIETHYLGATTVGALPSVLRRLTNLLQGHRPDVLQSFLFHANVLGPWAARRAGVAHVLTGIRVAERRAWHRWVARRTAHWVDRHVCVSQAVADFSANVTGLDPQSLLVIPNGVDVARFGQVAAADLTRWGVPADRRAFVCVGRLDLQKGVDWLLDLLPAVFAQQQSHDLLIVGQGPQQRALRRRAAKLGIAGRVHFAGQQSDIPAILAASDLLVLPSRWEGMPNVLLEAMAAAKPVVATEVEGVSELFGPEQGGQVVPVGDAQAFTSQLLVTIRELGLATALGDQNEQRIRAHFTIEHMVTAYERLLKSLD